MTFSKKLFKLVSVVWLCLEFGQFVQASSTWDEANLFWPFWISMNLVIILAALHVDRYIK